MNGYMTGLKRKGRFLSGVITTEELTDCSCMLFDVCFVVTEKKNDYVIIIRCEKNGSVLCF